MMPSVPPAAIRPAEKPGVVAGAAHLGQRHLGHRRRGRDRRAVDRREAAAGRDGRVGQAAAAVAEPGAPGDEQLAAHARVRGERAHQDEHRDHAQVVVGQHRQRHVASRFSAGAMPVSAPKPSTPTMPIAMPIGTRSAISTNMPTKPSSGDQITIHRGLSAAERRCRLARRWPRASSTSPQRAEQRRRRRRRRRRSAVEPDQRQAQVAGGLGAGAASTLTQTIQAIGARKASVTAPATRSSQRRAARRRGAPTATSTQMWPPW